MKLICLTFALLFICSCGGSDSLTAINTTTPSPGVVTTIAGSAGSTGSNDGLGSAAQFNGPRGITIISGNYYVTDYSSNKTIRKIDSSGNVTTFAGSAGVSGNTDGTGSAARFNWPEGITVDSSGNLFVTETGSAIRKITSGAVVTTFAGSGTTVGNTNGTGTAARFDSPSSIVMNSSGDFFVSDSFNHTIRKITSGGVVTTFAGTAGASGSTNATGAAARFRFPLGLAIDSSDNLYVIDQGNHTLRKITSAGVVTTLAGSPGIAGSTDGTGSSALFDTPYGVAVDSSGNVYVTDYFNHTVRKVTSTGVVTTIAGNAGVAGSTDGASLDARFAAPAGIAINGSGHLIIVDHVNSTIRRIILQ